jgi:iron complex outermembrane receptor protein
MSPRKDAAARRRSHSSLRTRAGGIKAAFMALLILALALPAGARAQSMDYGALESLFGEPVTRSATGGPQKLSEVPADMEIVTHDDIRRSGAKDLAGALRFVIGIDQRQYGALHAEIGMRGYNQPFNPRLLVMVNGRQVYLDDYGEVDWSGIPVQLDEIRQIEIIKGPNSALYGFNAAYGAINIVTYDPLYDDVNAATLRGGTGGYGGASLVKTLRLSDDAGVRFSVGGARADPYAGTTDFMAGLPIYRNRVGSFAADGKVRVGQGTFVKADVSAGDSRGAFNEGYSYSNVMIRTNSARIGIDTATPLGLFSVSAYRNEEHYSDVPNYGALDDRTYVLQASNLVALSPSHTVRLNAEYRNSRLAQSEGKVGYAIYAAGAMWAWQIAPRLSLTSSLRHDIVALRYAGSPIPESGLTEDDYNRRTFGATSFNAGLVYTVTDLDTVRLFAGRGLQIPSLYNLGVQAQIDDPAFPYALVGNPNLRPTSVFNIGIAYDREIAPLSSTAKVSLFGQRSDDIYQEPSAVAGVELASGNTLYQARNVGRAMAAGIEAEIKGSSPSGWRWQFAYAYVLTPDRTGTNSGPDPESYVDFGHSTPHHSVIAGLGRSWGPVEADLKARWQSGYRDYVAPDQVTLQRYSVAPYATVTGRVGYRLTDGLTVAISAEQLNAARIAQVAGPAVERRFILSTTFNF